MNITDKQLNDSLANPHKRLTWNEKIKDDYSWFKECADYYKRLALINGLSNSLVYNVSELVDSKEYWYNLLRDLYHNDINPALYASFVKSKYNKAKKEISTIRNLNIIKPNIDFIGSNFKKRKLPDDI